MSIYTSVRESDLHSAPPQRDAMMDTSVSGQCQFICFWFLQDHKRTECSCCPLGHAHGFLLFLHVWQLCLVPPPSSFLLFQGPLSFCCLLDCHVMLRKSIPVPGTGGPEGCEAKMSPHCLDKRLIDSGEVVGLAFRPRSNPQKYFSASGTHFC
jgi:hypothetical protein